MRAKKDLREYQVRLINEIKNRERVLLAVDMGLGKTVSCLTAIEELGNTVKRVLIVAPLTVATVTWPDELQEWEHLKDLTYTVVVGTEKKKLELLKNDSKIFLTNHHQLPFLYENTPEGFFDFIIYDESDTLKGGNLKTKGKKVEVGNGKYKIEDIKISRLGALCKMTARALKVVLLTGTPTSNGIQDIWGQIKALDPENPDIATLLGASKNKFYEKFFDNISYKREYPIWKPKPDSYQNIMSICEDGIIKMKSEDYLTLPDYITINRNIELSPKELKTYKELKSDLITSDEEIIAANPAVLVNKLLQLTSGCVYKEDGSYIVYHEQKIEALKELINENNNENMLILYNYKHEKEQLQKHFKDLVILKSKEEQDLWNAGKIKLLACNPKSAGHGLNLQYGGSVTVWLSLTYSLVTYQQANKRLHRSGQKNTVRCFHVVAKNTIDYDILDVLSGKKTLQELAESLMKMLNKNN